MIYESFVNFTKQSGDQLYGCCPLHQEDTPSFTVNKDSGKWYCHGCQQGGEPVHFLAAYYDVSTEVAEYAYSKWERVGRLPFPCEAEIEKYCSNLQVRSSEIDVLHQFGISDDTISKYQLGWDDLRITIPIRGRTGQLINIRKYLPPHRRTNGDSAKIKQLRGLGENRYFPYEAFKDQKIYVVEGEKDCLVARSQGLNAVTGTGGSNIPTNELHMFKDRDVYLMLDNDPVGAKSTKTYYQLLRAIATSVHILKLPEKDFADYWAKYQNTEVDKYEVVVHDEIKKDADVAVDSTTLSRSEHVEHLNSWVKLERMSVVGADPKTYTVPNKLKIVCKDVHCQRPCPVGVAQVPMEIDVDPRQLVQFVDANDNVQDQHVRKFFGCKSIQAEPASYINVQKILFQESASFIDGLEESTFENRYGIYLYENNRLTPTVRYDFEACRVTDPRNQQNYYVIRSADSVSDSVVNDLPKAVAYFKSISGRCSNAEQLINAHYEIWKPALGIEGRPDLFGAIALTYLSATELTWRGGTLKGWLDTMVIGDTRTGKSQMAQRFVKAVKRGNYINGENGRRTGVIGGVQRFGDSWVITWGAIPMNDKGLLAIDEASGLEVDDIKELSATRSSGAVTINKIAKGEARARTRLLWFSNPRSGKNLEDFYWKGYGAFTEFIPVVEDQARYDIVLTAARDDVERLEGNLRGGEVPDDVWRDLITVMWTIPRNSITIGKSVEDEIQKAAADLDAEYGGGPLVVAVAVHEKLIRLSTAFAALRGNFVEGPMNSTMLAVTPIDVQYSVQFLKMTYDKKSLDYRGYIHEYKKAQRKRAENTAYVRTLCVQYSAIRVLLSSNFFRGSQVREVLGLDQMEASKLISELLRRGLLRITGSGAYSPDKILIDMAKEMEVDL